MKKYLCVFLLFFQMLFIFRVDLLAICNELETVSVDQGTEERVLSHSKISFMTEEGEKLPLECFDVNANGMIVLGLADSGHNYLYVYSSEGAFRYGYSFECDGNFYVEWNQDNIELYFVRSDIIVILNPEEQTQSVVQITDYSEADRYINHVLQLRVREVGDAKYIMRCDMGILNLFATSYSQLLVVNGEETVMIYDVKSEAMTTVIVEVTGVCLFVSLVLSGLLIYCLRLRRNKDIRNKQIR